MKKMIVMGVILLFSFNCFALTSKTIEKTRKDLGEAISEKFKPSEEQPPPIPQNHAPEVANFLPVNNAINVATATMITWQVSDPDNDPVVSDLWFGTETLTPIAQGLTVSYYTLPLLNGSTTYKWRVKATDTRGSSTAGAIWIFTTVVPPPPPQLTKIELVLGTTTLYIGATTTATITAYYNNGSFVDVTAESEIASSNLQVVSVSGNALTAVGTGTSVITATYDSFTGSQTVTVVSPLPLIPLYGLAYGGRYQTEPDRKSVV